MKTGMLWLDNEPSSTLELKIEKAVKYYQQRFGQLPNLCFVNPSLLVQAEGAALLSVDVMGVEILPSQRLEPEQLWIGFKELVEAV
jgi:hypothetical protein